MKKYNYSILLAFLLLLSSCGDFKACIAEEFMQGKITDGVVRLSAQLSLLVKVLNTEGKPYSFDALMPKPKIEKSRDPNGYGRGKVTWTIQDQAIYFPNEEMVYEDCKGNKGFIKGSVKILEATRIMEGVLTGDEKNPVIPDPDKITIEIRALVDNLILRFSSAPGYLKYKRGEIAFSAKPRLAKSNDKETEGMMINQTSNLTLENIVLKNVKAKLYSKDINMSIPINDSKYNIQIGQRADGVENYVKGWIKTFGIVRDAPTDNSKLDPDYDRQKFIDTYKCELKGELSYDDPVEIDHKLGGPLVGLSGLLLGQVADAYQKDRRCGLASPGALKNVNIIGNPGDEGSATIVNKEKCDLSFINVTTDPDCMGVVYELNGAVKVKKNAKMTLSGLVVANTPGFLEQVAKYEKILNDPNPIRRQNEDLLKKNLPNPVVPITKNPAQLELAVDFSGLRVKRGCSNKGTTTHTHHCSRPTQEANFKSFTLKEGVIKAVITPEVAKVVDRKMLEFGLCAAPIPIVRIDLDIKDAKAVLEASFAELKPKFYFPLIGQVSLFIGPSRQGANKLEGETYIRGKKMTYVSEALDPNYSKEKFIDTFSCKKVALVNHDDQYDQCNPKEVFAQNIARLLVLNASALMKVAEGELRNPVNILTSAELLNNDTQMTIDAKRIIPLTNSGEEPVYTDKLGNRLFINGTVNGTPFSPFKSQMIRDGVKIHPGLGKVLSLWHEKEEGLKTDVVLIRPNKPESTKIKIQASVANFYGMQVESGEEDPDGYLLMKTGDFNIEANPILGQNKLVNVDDLSTIKDDRGPSFSIQTPIVKFQQIEVKKAFVVLHSFGMSIPFYIESADLKAMNGKYKGEGNYIRGTIKFKIQTSPTEVPQDLGDPIGVHEDLVPYMGFNQEKFDNSYRNTPNLKEVFLPN